MPPFAPPFSSAALSDQGRVRGNNEDRVYSDSRRGLFLVADGMGGHEAGEHAAEIAVERIRSRLERQTGSPEQRLREAIALANNAIYDAARQNPEWHGMACVLTAAIVEDDQVTVGHVGDSRLYRIKRGAIEKMTHDHSPVGEREDSGELSETDAMQHPRRNEVFRDVGSEQRAPDDPDFIEIVSFPFEAAAALLLCSDGLSDALPSGDILRIVEQNAGNPQLAVRKLISAASQVGHDNISAVVVEGSGFASSFGKRSRKRRSDAPVEKSYAAGETTDRLTPAAAPLAHAWYRSAPACLAYGAVLGVLLLFSIEKLRAPEKPAHPVRILAVAAPGSIAAALAQARPGDTVSVAAGMYSESFNLAEGVNLTAQQPRDVILNGSISAGNLHRARVEGFSIRGGGVAVRIHNSNVVLANDEILSAREAGIAFSGDSKGAVFACYIHDNLGPGILLDAAAAPAIEHNLILHNGAAPASLRPGILVRPNAHPFIAANIFSANGAEALWVPAADDNLVLRNSFTLAGKPDERPKVRLISIQVGGEP
ncbi:MAG: protein phosphatase 2C domain-containing protein [Acidobacteriaceae bacterium]|nr:protein phosphatase 2C domain-containing protein [Acidobacteriaceae bacterium]